MIDLIAIDTNDGPVFLRRIAAHALASGGTFDPITEHVIGGDPHSTNLPQNARELTEAEKAQVLNRLRMFRKPT